ncbi:MAG: diguanylate cyclase [Betaproteobacteria bacterium]
MTNYLRTSIAVRSAVAIVAIVGAVGLCFLVLALLLTTRQEDVKQQAHLHELLDTVERTVSIACFLADRQLADEVALGLLSNKTVSHVMISAGADRLANRGKGFAGSETATFPAGTLVRKVANPFNANETVGEIALVPDAAEIRSTVVRASLITSMLLAGQVIIVGLGVVAVVIRLITRPISTISARLHELRAETGQKLAVPRGNEADEIGQLVRDVNALADYLVSILNEERRLRLDREMGEKKFRAIFEHAHTGIFVIDEFEHLISYNPACARLFGMKIPATAGGSQPVFADMIGKRAEEVAALTGRAISENGSAGQDIKLDGKAGAPTRWVNVVLTPIDDNRLQGVVNDVTERKRAGEAAQALAATDPLTSLGNRLGFELRLEQAMDRCYRDPNYRFTLLLLDLDWFKQINDTYGHPVGDDVLIRVARKMEQAVRKTDFVGRLGGDEFVVLLDATSRRDLIEFIMRKILAGIGEPIPLGGGATATIGASIGAVVFDRDTMSREELIRRADLAMYGAKDGGRNTYRFFEELDGA